MAVKVNQMQELFNEGHSIIDVLPYLYFDQDMHILADGSLGCAWQLSMQPSEGKSEAELWTMINQWENLLNRIPHDQTAYQFILVCSQDTSSPLGQYMKYVEDNGRVQKMSYRADFIQANSGRLFKHKEELFRAKSFKLFFTMRYFPQWEHQRFHLWGWQARQTGSAGDKYAQLAIHQLEFQARMKLCAGALQALGICPQVLDGEGLTKQLYGFLNPGQMGRMERKGFDEDEEIRQQIIYHHPKATGAGFILEDTHVQVLTLKGIGPHTIPGMMTREMIGANQFCLLDMPVDMVYVLNLTVMGADEAMAKLNRQKSFAFMHQENWLGDKSVEAVEKKKEIDETISQIYTSNQKVIKARAHWLIYGPSQAETKAAGQALSGGLSRLGCEVIPEEIIGASLFISALPLNFDPYYEQFIRRARRLKSDNASDLLPVLGSFAGTQTPAQMYFNRRGEIVYLDFFDSNTNPHAVIVGASGAGKSFFVNDFILQNNRLGAHVFILDKGDSYKKLNSIIGGQYISFDFNQPVTINPFHCEPTAENMSFLLTLLSCMASGSDERDRLNREEEGLLQRAITVAFERNPAGHEMTLSDITAILNENEFNHKYGINSLMGPTLALRLTPFTGKGAYGGFFDGKNQLVINEQMTVFELANLSAYPDLQTVVLLNLMFFITKAVSHREMKSKRKYLLIDEAWSLLKLKNTADFITNAFKTFRKYRCSAVAITQEMADLTKLETGVAIIANTANKIFLRQDPVVVDLLKGSLSLDEGVLSVLKTLETVKGKFSEAFVITDSDKGVIRLVPDPFLYWVANSEPAMNEILMNKIQKCNGNVHKAVYECAKEYGYGPSQS